MHRAMSISLEHSLKSSNVKEDKFSNASGNVNKLEHSLKSSDVKEDKFPNASGNVDNLETFLQIE